MTELQARGFEEFARYVNPLLAQRATLAREPWQVVSTDAGRLVDADGRVFEDLHGTQALGHRHPHITAALQEFLASPVPNWYPSRLTPHAGRLARRLCERTGYEKVFFAASGSDSVEAAIKLARAATGRSKILCLEGAYHGCGLGSTALMADGPFKAPFGPLLPGVVAIPFGDVAALSAALLGGDIGVVVVEPIQGEGGVRVLPEAFVAALCDLTAQTGTLLVADEVQTGLGRTGHFLRSSLWPRRPDVVLLAKLLGGGQMPLSAMLTTTDLFLRAYGQDFEDGESHNITFSYNALAMVAGLATLEVLDDALVAQIQQKGRLIRAALQQHLAEHALVEEIRGEGLMLGLKLRPLDHPWLSFEHFGFHGLLGRATVSPLLCHRLYRHGWFCFTCGHDWSVFRLQPRYHFPEECIERLARDIRTELDWLLETSL